MKTTFIQCSCSSEALCLEKDQEDDLLHISIWERGYGRSNKLTWKQKISYCWRILTKGCPYGDQIVLNKEGRSELIYALVNSYIISKAKNDSGS